jgi:hypothetical protein
MGTSYEFSIRASRLGLLLLVLSNSAGCQSADPLAAFGPYKVPPPTTAHVSPYDPPTVTPSTTTRAEQPVEKVASPRAFVSVETLPFSTSPARLATDPADRQPIRVVENPAATTRTAAASSRGSFTTDANQSSTATAK